MRDTVLRLTGATRHANRVLDEPVQPPPTGRTAVVGPNPIRVLVAGAGTAVGRGVTTRELALDGCLARLLAERIGRGVVVEPRIRPDLRMTDAVDALREIGAHTFDVVVWSVSFREAVRLVPGRTWEAEVRRALEHLRATGSPALRVLLLGVPEIVDPTAVGAVSRVRRRRVASRIERAAVGMAGVTTVHPPPIGPFGPEAVIWDADYYERCAMLLVDALERSGLVGRRTG